MCTVCTLLWCTSTVDPFQCGRWTMEALVVSARRLNRLIGRTHSNQTLHNLTTFKAQSDLTQSLRLNQTDIQGRDGSTAPVTPPITGQPNLLFVCFSHLVRVPKMSLILYQMHVDWKCSVIFNSPLHKMYLLLVMITIYQN